MGEQVVARLSWGCSSVGRAPALQAGGQEFESLHLHSVSLIPHTYLENRILKKDNLFERKKYQDIRGRIFRKKDTDNKQ